MQYLGLLADCLPHFGKRFVHEVGSTPYIWEIVSGVRLANQIMLVGPPHVWMISSIDTNPTYRADTLNSEVENNLRDARSISSI